MRHYRHRRRLDKVEAVWVGGRSHIQHTAVDPDKGGSQPTYAGINNLSGSSRVQVLSNWQTNVTALYQFQ